MFGRTIAELVETNGVDGGWSRSLSLSIPSVLTLRCRAIAGRLVIMCPSLFLELLLPVVYFLPRVLCSPYILWIPLISSSSVHRLLAFLWFNRALQVTFSRLLCLLSRSTLRDTPRDITTLLLVSLHTKIISVTVVADFLERHFCFYLLELTRRRSLRL